MKKNKNLEINSFEKQFKKNTFKKLKKRTVFGKKIKGEKSQNNSLIVNNSFQNLKQKSLL